MICPRTIKFRRWLPDGCDRLPFSVALGLRLMVGRQVYLSDGISTKLGFGIAFIRVYVLAWLVVMLDQHLRVTQTNRALVKRNGRR